ncbi:hypothetical protein [Streptomyces sp. NBC_00147]|uniref:hypothetical protein n=1 Tax=Streptomyces sp. NBC_00147 TaxID=2975667 RepID=UPI003245C067
MPGVVGAWDHLVLMKVSWAVRSLRAAVFALLCMVLAVGGHVLATGVPPPLWVDGAGLVPLFVTGCLAGGRERSLAGIGGGMLAAQAGLHIAFDRARTGSITMRGMRGMRMPQHAPHHAMSSHAVGAHLIAALIASWCLRRGEAALWALLRRAAALVPGLAAWWCARPLPRCASPVGVYASRPRCVRHALLRHTVTRRGPPRRTRTQPITSPQYGVHSSCSRNAPPPCAAPAWWPLSQLPAS